MAFGHVFLLCALAYGYKVSPFGIEDRRICSVHKSEQALYASTENGIYRKNTTGQESDWEHLGFTSQTIGRLCVDPLTSSTLYAGLWFPYSGAPLTTPSLYRSIDGGASWEPANQGIDSPHSLSDIEAVVTTTETVLNVAASGAFYRSTDSAVSWQRIWPPEPATLGEVADLAVCPSSPDTIYMLFRHIDLNSCSKSVDGGINWAGLSKLFPLGFCGLAVHPGNANIVYIASGPVWKSTNGGATFQDMGAHGSGLVAVHPQQPEQIVAASNQAGFLIYESRNGGRNWSRIANDPWRPSILCIEWDAANPRIIYVGTESGVFRIETPEEWIFEMGCEEDWGLYE